VFETPVLGHLKVREKKWKYIKLQKAFLKMRKCFTTNIKANFVMRMVSSPHFLFSLLSKDGKNVKNLNEVEIVEVLLHYK